MFGGCESKPRAPRSAGAGATTSRHRGNRGARRSQSTTRAGRLIRPPTRNVVRFLHTSDWQLGMTRRFLAGEAQGRFAQARIDAVTAVGRIAAERGAEFVVVAGDVFEHNQVTSQTVRRAFEALATIHVPVFLLPGNHDPLDAGSVFGSRAFAAGRPPHVIVLEGEAPVPVPGVPGVEVLGAPWTSKKPLEDLLGRAIRTAPPPAPGILRVAVGHGGVDALNPDRDDPAAIRLATLDQAVAERRVAYVALGDKHSATAVGASGAIHYSGAPEPTDFDEPRPGFVLVVDATPNTPPRVDEVRVGTWHFVDIAAELDGAASITALEERLAALPAKACTVVRLALTGSLSVAETARLEDLLLAQVDVFASIRRWERAERLVVRPADLDLDALGLSGYARSAWQALEEQARGSDDAAERARDALILFHRLAQETSA